MAASQIDYDSEYGTVSVQQYSEMFADIKVLKQQTHDILAQQSIMNEKFDSDEFVHRKEFESRVDYTDEKLRQLNGQKWISAVAVGVIGSIISALATLALLGK